MNPIISIILPVYNCEKFIKKCIKSIQKQSLNNFEVIIVDDGSTDNTMFFIKKMIENDARFKVYKQVHGGVSRARNLALNNIKGKYIVFIDADDYINADYLDILLDKISNSDADIVTMGYKEITKDQIQVINDYTDVEICLDKETFISKLFEGTGGTLWGKIFKKDIIANNNLKFNPRIYMCEDLIFLLEYVLKCNKFLSLDKNLYFYNRLNENSITFNFNLSYFDNHLFVIKQIENILINSTLPYTNINKILAKRVNQFIFTYLICLQDDSKIPCLEKIRIIKNILNNEDIIRFQKLNKQDTSVNSVYMFLLNNRYYFILFMYFYTVNKWRIFKGKIKKYLFTRRCYEIYKTHKKSI